MSNQAHVTVNTTTAAEICARFNVKKEALALLRAGAGPREFVEALAAGKQYLTGIDFMAHALSAREAVWWGCLCLQHTCGDNLPPADKAACTAAVRWVLEPSEENRAGALAPAQAAGQASAAGGLAMAVYQTGGNVAPPGLPPASPRPFAHSKAVAGAIKMACTKADPVKIVEAQRLFLGLAIGMAANRSW